MMIRKIGNVNGTTPILRRRRRVRRHSRDPARSLFLIVVVAIVLLVAIIAVPSFFVAIGRRIVFGRPGDGRDVDVDVEAVGVGRLVRKWKAGQLHRASRKTANVPASVEDLEAEMRAERREEKFRSLYVPKYDISTLGYDIHDCPHVPPPGYPKSWRAADVLGSWPPDDVIVASSDSPREVHQGLCVFDHDTQLDRAKRYRDAELPFVLRGDTVVSAASRRWADDPEYLHRALGDTVEYRVERSPNSDFMWYRLRGPGGRGKEGKMMAMPMPKDFVLPPNDEVEMTFGEWLERAMERDGIALGDEDMMSRADSLRERRMIMKKKDNGRGGEDIPFDDDAAGAARKDTNGDDSEEAKKEKYYYFRLNANLHEVEDESSPSKFLYDELPFLDPRREESKFYIVEPRQQRGINCRFGMRGVTAANHFDMSRNTIVVLGGERRYVLAHPGQCDRMALHPKGHPSVRHSSFDWGDPREREKRPEFEDALLQEVVLHEGDVLYLPTNWFHFIVNLSLNYQCNARSGTTFETADVVGACGFKMKPGDFQVR